jgi:hypothetical protein
MKKLIYWVVSSMMTANEYVCRVNPESIAAHPMISYDYPITGLLQLKVHLWNAFVSEPTVQPTIIPGTNKPPGTKIPAVKIVNRYQVRPKINRAIHFWLMVWFIKARITPLSVLKKSVVWAGESKVAHVVVVLIKAVVWIARTQGRKPKERTCCCNRKH